MSKLKLLTEDVISLKDVPKLLPNRPNHSTVWRWTKRGVAGVKLETVQIGGSPCIFTSKQAVTRFLQRVNDECQ